MNNLGVIARAFAEHYPILRVDLRNHGQSFHSETMNYDLMAQDLLTTLDHLGLNKVILIGHSMGGKTAMRAAALRPDLVRKLVVIDIAPVTYGEHGHDSVFAGLFAVKAAQPATRQQAKPILAQHIPQESVQQFMLKSFDPASVEKFRFNLTALYQNYAQIMDWQPCFYPNPTLLFAAGFLITFCRNTANRFWHSSPTRHHSPLTAADIGYTRKNLKPSCGLFPLFSQLT